MKAVENILRNLADYAYLSEHPLVQTRLIASRLPAAATTHLNRGKLVCQVLAKAIEKLRHTGPLPADPPPTEWYPHLDIPFIQCYHTALV